MSPELRALLAGFAAYRLAQLLAIDDGPYRLIARFRAWIGRRAARTQGRGSWWMLGELIHCPYCLGIWFAMCLVPLQMFPSFPGDAVLLALGVAGAQSLLQDLSKR